MDTVWDITHNVTLILWSWTFVNLHGPLWTFMEFCELSWTFVNLHEPLWTFMDLCEPSWNFVNFHGPLWTFMNLCEPSWTFVNIPCRLHMSGSIYNCKCTLPLLTYMSVDLCFRSLLRWPFLRGSTLLSTYFRYILEKLRIQILGFTYLLMVCEPFGT